MHTLLLFVFSGYGLLGVGVGILAIIGLIYQLSVKNRFASLDVDLDSMVQARTAKLSAIGTIIAQSVEVVDQGRDFAAEIVEKITQARVAGTGELLRVLTEGNIPISPDLFSDLLPTIQGSWKELEQSEVSIQSVLATRNKMLVVVPQKWFLSGEKRQINPIVSEEAAAMAASGTLKLQPLFPVKK